MHAPPSVSYPVGRSAFAARLACAIGAAGVLVATAWSLQSPFGWRQVAGFATLFAAASFAWWAARRAPTGVLHWDGKAWTWEEGGRAAGGRPELAFDLQSRLLLRWRPETARATGAGVRWLWLERKSAPSHWDALRRAVYSRASTQVPAAGKLPAAEQ